MPASQFSSDPETTSSTSSRMSDTVEQTRSKINELGSAAADRIDQNRMAAASGLEGAAGTLHQRADQLPGGERVSGMAHSAADKLSATADYVRQHDLNSMMQDLENLVKNNPGPSLLIAAGLGFLVARAFSSDSRG